MIALDTNVLARLLLRDDEQQYRKALQLLADGRDYTAPPTVILELVWVLASYDVAKADIAQALRGLLGLPNFKPRQSGEISVALSLYEAGLDFADALHLASSDGEDALLTFDTRFAGRAERLDTTPTVKLVG
jgi:predicted nucleic acid-binding protein